jgi:hypothetical protein
MVKKIKMKKKWRKKKSELRGTRAIDESSHGSKKTHEIYMLDPSHSAEDSSITMYNQK